MRAAAAVATVAALVEETVAVTFTFGRQVTAKGMTAGFCMSGDTASACDIESRDNYRLGCLRC